MEDLRFAGVEEALTHMAALDESLIYYELDVSISRVDVSEDFPFSRTCELVAKVFKYCEWECMEIALLENLPPSYLHFHEVFGHENSLIDRFLPFFHQEVDYWRVAGALRRAGFGACPALFDKQRIARKSDQCKSIEEKRALQVVDRGFRNMTRYRVTDKEMAEFIRIRDEEVAKILGHKRPRQPRRRSSQS